jgi:two-component system, NarL family, nitrate/nitrite response regulator NarL
MDKTKRGIRVLIADDHPIFRTGLRRVLEARPGLVVVNEASDGEQAVKMARQLKPDILLLDLSMPSLSGFEVLRELSVPAIPVRAIILTASIDPPQVVQALQLGACGVVVKDTASETLIKGIHAVVAGQYWIGHESVTDLVKALRTLVPQVAESERRKTFGLTPRELEVVSAVVLGYTNKSIADKFSISEDTVKRHMTNIFDKVGVSNRLELALLSLKNNLVGNL